MGVIKQNIMTYKEWYHEPVFLPNNTASQLELAIIENGDKLDDREQWLLWLILELTTFVIAFYMYNAFKQTPYLRKSVRNFFADYSLFISVIIVTLIYNTCFKDINFDPFVPHYT